jgi:hypothetical protein
VGAEGWRGRPCGGEIAVEEEEVVGEEELVEEAETVEQSLRVSSVQQLGHKDVDHAGKGLELATYLNDGAFLNHAFELVKV